jgi:hypothetical protein
MSVKVNVNVSVTAKIADFMHRVAASVSKSDENINIGTWLRHALALFHVYSTESSAEIICEKVVHSGLAVGNHMRTVRIETEEKIHLATISSITVDGMLLHHGIPVYPRGGGIVQVKGGKALRFIEFIDYRSITMYPEDVFIDLHLTAVNSMMKTGDGRIIVDIREIPVAAQEDAEEVLSELGDAGLGCVLEISDPEWDILGIPVSKGRIGIALISGANPIAAAKEEGIEIYERGYVLRDLSTFLFEEKVLHRL